MKKLSLFPNHKKALLTTLIGLVLIFLVTCKKETISTKDERTGLGNNPYSGIDIQNPLPNDIKIDSNSFLGIYTFLLNKKCNQPACHDGSFEPDYRSIESAYNTLVFAHPIKDSINGKKYIYRVQPNDYQSSWLYTRVTTSNQVLGRMPLYGNALNDRELLHLKTWITNGAKNVFDQSPSVPNALPQFYGVYASLPNDGDFRVDTIRGNVIVNPFIIPKNKKVKVYFGLYDDKTLPPFFKNLKVICTNTPENENSGKNYSVNVQTTPINLPYFGSKKGQVLPYYLSFTFNSSDFQTGEIIFMKFQVQDEDHSLPIIIPAPKSSFQLQTYFSFVVK